MASTLPNLKHLQYLLALHQHQNFNRAAEACFVSQSTLSSAILKLEEQLGCQLLERDHKSFVFTPHGEEVVKKARQIIVATTELADFCQHHGTPFGGGLRLGSIPTIAPYVLTDLARICHEELPELSLFLREDTTENLMRMLADGEIDVALLALPVQQHSFQQKVVGKDAFYIAGNPALITKVKTQSDYRLLPQHSIFLLSQEHCLSEHAVSACNVEDQTLINPFFSSSLTTLVQMAAYHNGVTFLPEMAVDKGVGSEEGLALEKMPNDMYREIGLLWRTTSMRQRLYAKLTNIISTLFEKN
ncbi:LysR family transcriptional regulator [Thalassotalea sp. M1531]|uniref:LysR family transcriptional regulator n=1 Tax=Thalassotalea algicola TaxID=2716224 RepID=A0A7Y0LAK9_9GAMM|nr:hydrogen peroxide-inducible genes activator [Thalassotalea algicola]NMP31005.1 LysR family transcriptional regulator [Thalassotalea algicola]